MYDILPDTPTFDMETWCPDCQGPSTNERAMLAYCQIHYAAMPRGTADAAVNLSVDAIWQADAGGDPNRAVCDLIHRRKETP
jgi:hypothetical protein